jgi:hypothetical protein
MKKSVSKIIDYHIKTNQNNTHHNKNLKTTNINILLNRVRLQKENSTKKKLIFFTQYRKYFIFFKYNKSGK